MLAAFVCALGLTTCAVSVSVSAADGSTTPTFQIPVDAVYVPWLALNDTSAKPAGSRSLTRTFVAGSGPRSFTATVNVIVSPTLGVASLTDLATARSAWCGVSVALAVLFPGSGSNWSAWLIVAVFVCALALDTRAAMISVCGAAVDTVPTVHSPVVLLYVPALGAADTNVNP